MNSSSKEDSIGIEILALLAFFVTMPMYSPNIEPIQEYIDNSDIMDAFIHSMMPAAIAASAILFGFSLFRPQFAFTEKRSRITLSCTVYLLGMALFLGMALSSFLCNVIIATVSGILLGLGLCMMVVIWGSRFSTFNLKQALLLMCVVCGSTGAANWIFSFLPSTPLVATMAVLAVAGTLYPVLMTSTEKSDDTQGSHESLDDMPCLHEKADASVLAQTSKQPVSHTMYRFLTVMFPALIGLSIFAFFMGVSRVTVFEGTNAEIVGSMLAGILLALLYVLPSRRPFFITLYQIVLPLGACAMLCFMVLAYDFGTMDAFIPLIAYIFFCGIAQISLALGMASMKNREFSASTVWSFYLLLFSSFSAVGLFLGYPSAADDSQFISTTILALYCAFLIANAIVSFTKDSALPTPAKEQTSDQSEKTISFEERCEALAKKFSLSPREHEIMTLLGRGHTSAFIAKSLIISESTVYTHARNIYRKIGIGSKEELIQTLSLPYKEQSEDSSVDQREELNQF